MVCVINVGSNAINSMANGSNEVLKKRLASLKYSYTTPITKGNTARCEIKSVFPKSFQTKVKYTGKSGNPPVSTFAGAIKLLNYLENKIIKVAYDWELEKCRELNIQTIDSPIFVQTNTFPSNIAPNGYKKL